MEAIPGKHHDQLVATMAMQLQIVLDRSKQGVYIYLDDAHKVCNQQFAEMVGYESPDAWAATQAPLDDVVPEDQPEVIKAYRNAAEKLSAGCLPVRFRSARTHRVVKTSMVIVPLTDAEGHVFTIQFFSKA